MPSFIKKIHNRISEKKWERAHPAVRQSYRERFVGKTPTIISCNCIGGILYHELGLQFTSPLINLYMRCEDFTKFCEKMEYYLSLEITEYDGDIERDYPLGMLGDLVIYFVHYDTLQQAREKWNERRSRMDFDNIYIIATDRDGFNENLCQRFLDLPYKHKKLFAHLPYNSRDIVYIKGFEKEEQVEGLMYHTKDGHFLIDQFDWVSWFNGQLE